MFCSYTATLKFSSITYLCKTENVTSGSCTLPWHIPPTIITSIVPKIHCIGIYFNTSFKFKRCFIWCHYLEMTIYKYLFLFCVDFRWFIKKTLNFTFLKVKSIAYSTSQGPINVNQWFIHFFRSVLR